jgi:hypothetical protein
MGIDEDFSRANAAFGQPSKDLLKLRGVKAGGCHSGAQDKSNSPQTAILIFFALNKYGFFLLSISFSLRVFSDSMRLSWKAVMFSVTKPITQSPF